MTATVAILIFYWIRCDCPQARAPSILVDLVQESFYQSFNFYTQNI